MPENRDSALLSDAWWAALVADLMHPVQVEVIEACRHIGQPLTVRDLSEIVDVVEGVHLDYHVGRLRRLRVLDHGFLRKGMDFMDVPYELVVERSSHGRR